MSSKPLIFNYYEFDESIHSTYLEKTDQIFKLKCKNCTKFISGSVKVNSNWKTHLRVRHVEKLNEYEQSMSNQTTPAVTKVNNTPTRVSSSVVKCQLFPSLK